MMCAIDDDKSWVDEFNRKCSVWTGAEGGNAETGHILLHNRKKTRTFIVIEYSFEGDEDAEDDNVEMI